MFDARSETLFCRSPVDAFKAEGFFWDRPDLRLGLRLQAESSTCCGVKSLLRQSEQGDA